MIVSPLLIIYFHSIQIRNNSHARQASYHNFLNTQPEPIVFTPGNLVIVSTNDEDEIKLLSRDLDSILRVLLSPNFWTFFNYTYLIKLDM